VSSVSRKTSYADLPLAQADPDVSRLVDQELARQQQSIMLIASENFSSVAVLEAVGSVLTNKYAEGYPGARYYGGCEIIDDVETLAIDRAKALFGAEHANVQPHSGSTANQAVYFSVLEHGDSVLSMNLSHGGHLTHGMAINFSGRLYHFHHYGVDRESGRIDMAEVLAQAKSTKPKLIVAGSSSYARTIDFAAFRAVADEVGAQLMVDIAHIAGLVAAGVHPSPLPHSQWVTTTTHKTLAGPRGGTVFCLRKDAERLDKAIFPGLQGGPLEHVIAGKAVCFLQAATEEFKAKQEATVENARVLAQSLLDGGLKLVSGGTDNHLMLIDFTDTEMTGALAQELVRRVGIVANKNVVPHETRGPAVTSGLRLGTPAMTTRGFGPEEMREVGDIILQALDQKTSEADMAKLLERSRALSAAFPLYPTLKA